ncbi:MAG: hypothetical protein LPJ91_10930 [Pseudazoarcus pumilus]|nr:hypothetical protein [Pseudazoarcus pumilus]
MTQNPINPATGLPMTSDSEAGIDVGGSPWGVDTNSYNSPWSSNDVFTDDHSWSNNDS